LDESAIRLHVDKARAGDAEALGALFEAFASDVERLCLRLLGSGADAEDARSETFLRAGRALSSYDDTRPFRTWLLSIAAHHAIDHLRRRATERRLFAPTPADVADVSDPGPSPLHGELRAERQRQVVSAIDALPERYRAPLVLCYFAELSYEEIASQLELTQAQVGMLLFRARRELRKTLAREGTS
jgi:RNA polymerase sigma-70 factor (ECF subfamily)